MSRQLLTMNRQLLVVAVILYCSLISSAFAGDIAREIRGDEDSNFFDISVGLIYGRELRFSPDNGDKKESAGGSLGLSWRYQWKGFFTEAIDSSYTGLNLGYKLWQSDRWTIDFIAVNVVGDFNDGDEISQEMNETARNESLLNRDTVTINAGVRVTHYWRNNIVQMRLESDYSHEDGGAAGVLVFGRAWQLRNWNVHGLAGVHWDSRQRSDYLWSIPELEATTRFPEYRATSAIHYSLEAGVTRPLSEHWVSRSAFVIGRQGDSAANSPLATGEWFGWVQTSIAYVF